MPAEVPPRRLGLGATFLIPRPAETSPTASPELDAAVELAVATARQAWPNIALPTDYFVAYMGQRVDQGLTPIEALAALRVSDLYLACACVRGDRNAIVALETLYLSRLRHTLARFDSAASFADDVIQELRVGLLVGNKSAAHPEPKLAQYRGRGALRGWLEVSAKRLALVLKSEAPAMLDLDQLATITSTRDPELDHLRRRYSDDFRHVIKQAVSESLAALPVEDRNLVRWHLVEKVSMRKLALIRGTNVSTVSRDFARIRQGILNHARTMLASRVGLATSEVDSMVGALISRISISMTAVLAPTT